MQSSVWQMTIFTMYQGNVFIYGHIVRNDTIYRCVIIPDQNNAISELQGHHGQKSQNK